MMFPRSDLRRMMLANMLEATADITIHIIKCYTKFSIATPITAAFKYRVVQKVRRYKIINKSY